MIELTNSLADLAERIKVTNGEFTAAQRITAEKAIEIGRLLCEAKELCQHGEWMPMLARSGVGDRWARRLMQITRSGLKADTVTVLGIKGSLEDLTARRLPGKGECLLVSEKGWTDGDERPPLACISPSVKHPGFFDIAGLDLVAEPPVGFNLRKPIRGEVVRMPDGTFIFPLWEVVDSFLTVPFEDREFTIVQDDMTWMRDLEAAA